MQQKMTALKRSLCIIIIFWLINGVIGSTATAKTMPSVGQAATKALRLTEHPGPVALEAQAHPNPAATLTQLGQLPLSFIPNQGQINAEDVHYHLRSLGGNLYFKPDAVILALPLPQTAVNRDETWPDEAPAARPQTTLRLQFEGANPQPTISPLDALPGKVNYFMGDDPNQWQTDIPTYKGVLYEALYPGIDLQYDGHEGLLKGTFIVAPGVDPNQIRWRYQGIKRVRVDETTGDLQLDLLTADGSVAQLIEQAPVAWQEIEGERVDVAVAFQVLDDQQIQFALGAYHPAYALVLDPTLVYSTFLGGRASDEGEAIAVDQAGQVYVTGYTRSTDFPTSEGAHDRLIHITYGGDIFVVKLNISGDALIYSTFLGGNRSEKAYAIAVDRGGQAYITGRTGSNDFPTTAAAYDTTHAHGSGSYGSDIFITKLNEDGSDLIYSTFLGGSDRSEKARTIAVDTSGQAYITGYTDSNDFPTTAGAYDTTHNGSNDVFITKLNESGSDLVYSTFLGGSANDVANEIALDRTGRVYVTGYTYSDDFPTTAGAYDTTLNGRDDGFVTKLNENGSALVYSTFLGGSAYTSYSSDERAEAMVVDNLGQVYVTGYTRSDDFPTTAGAYDTTHNGHRDVFVTKLNKQGSALVYSTFLGGISSDVAYGIALDRIGQVYVTGYIYSDDFPTTAGAYDTTRDGYSDVFVTQLNEQGSDLVYSTFWGGKSYETGRSIVVDNAERVYLTGSTRSSDFPTTAGAYDETYNGGYLALVDAFITRFDFASPASSDDPNIVVPTPTDPNLLVPEENDTTFVTGGKGPTACIFNSGSPLSIPLYVDRYVGPVNSDGTLENPTLLIDNHVVSAQARLRIAAFDADFDASDPSSEIDEIYFNDVKLSKPLRGQNETWVVDSFDVPIGLIKFPERADAGEMPETVQNWIDIEIDTANTTEAWCVAIDWISLEFEAMAPILLVHGTDSSSAFWEPTVTGGQVVELLDVPTFLEDRGIPFEYEISLGEEFSGNGTIADNALELNEVISTTALSFGVEKVHLVSHSKGGLDSRYYLSHYNDPNEVKVLSLHTLSTPHEGSVLADITSAAWEAWEDDIMIFPDWIRDEQVEKDIANILVSYRALQGIPGPAYPALPNLRTDSMASFNERHPLPPNDVALFLYGGDADWDNNEEISFQEFFGLFPVGFGAIASRQYRILRHVSRIKVTDHIDDSISPPHKWRILEIASLEAEPLDNDLVVSFKSASHGQDINWYDLNHSTVKNINVIQDILDQIQTTFPVN